MNIIVNLTHLKINEPIDSSITTYNGLFLSPVVEVPALTLAPSPPLDLAPTAWPIACNCALDMLLRPCTCTSLLSEPEASSARAIFSSARWYVVSQAALEAYRPV